MKIFTILCGLLFLCNIEAVAKSRKSLGVVSLMNFVHVLSHYKENNQGLYPVSWEEFDHKVDNQHLSIVERAVKDVDLKNRYVFFEAPPEFVIYGKK